MNFLDGLININGKIFVLFVVGKFLRKVKVFLCVFCEKSFFCNVLWYKYFFFIYLRFGGLVEKELVILENILVNKFLRVLLYKVVGIVLFNFNEIVGLGGNNFGICFLRLRNGLVRGKYGIGKVVCRICYLNIFGIVL